MKTAYDGEKEFLETTNDFISYRKGMSDSPLITDKTIAATKSVCKKSVGVGGNCDEWQE